MSAVDETVVAAAPRVLVLMAAYGGQRWIAEQLGSILAQRGVAVRVRVSDDRSHDGTADVVRELAGRDDRVSLVVRAESSGSAGANFRSLLADADLSAADFVALSDQDDVWDSDHLVRGCEALRARRGACRRKTSRSSSPMSSSSSTRSARASRRPRRRCAPSSGSSCLRSW